jgi:hypothetical protein
MTTLELKAKPKLTLKAASATPVLTDRQREVLYHEIDMLGTDRVRAFAAALTSAEFTVHTSSNKWGKRHKVWALANTEFPAIEGNNHNLANVVMPVRWLFEAAARDAGFLDSGGESDSRSSKVVLVSFSLAKGDLLQKEIEETMKRTEAALTRILPTALAQGMQLTLEGCARVEAVHTARTAASVAAHAAVESAKKTEGYAEKLAVLRENVRRGAEGIFATYGFTDLDTDALLLITPEVREKAIKTALDAGLYDGFLFPGHRDDDHLIPLVPTPEPPAPPAAVQSAGASDAE